ncbi:MAG: OmpA family protein [Bacteroidia bacterium]|nr:OmpA family protein [Bacteroidia bacterium]
MNKRTHIHKTILATCASIVLFFLCVTIHAQTKAPSKSKNLVPNPGFETHKGKSNVITNAVPWKNVGTVDYYMKPEKRDTSRFKGAHSGTCYAGLRFQSEYKEYMYVPLTETLERGQTYKFSMYVRLLNASTVTIKQLGVYFSEFVYDKNMTFNKENQIDTSYSKGISGTLDWIPIKGEYVAKGGEKYIIIGNFNQMHEDMVRVNKWNIFEFKEAYYYIDDVSLKKKSTKKDSLSAYKYKMENAIPDFPDNLNTGDAITITNLQFENGTALIKTASYKILDEVVKTLNNHPFAEIMIVGHTDNTGNEASNRKLSKDRAKAVHDYLKEQGVINPITYKGMGPSQPVAPNDTDENKAKNSRVEFIVIKE